MNVYLFALASVEEGLRSTAEQLGTTKHRYALLCGNAYARTTHARSHTCLGSWIPAQNKPYMYT